MVGSVVTVGGDVVPVGGLGSGLGDGGDGVLGVLGGRLCDGVGSGLALEGLLVGLVGLVGRVECGVGSFGVVVGDFGDGVRLNSFGVFGGGGCRFGVCCFGVGMGLVFGVRGVVGSDLVLCGRVVRVFWGDSSYATLRGYRSVVGGGGVGGCGVRVQNFSVGGDLVCELGGDLVGVGGCLSGVLGRGLVAGLSGV